jgi:hypothetical protein
MMTKWYERPVVAFVGGYFVCMAVMVVDAKICGLQVHTGQCHLLPTPGHEETEKPPRVTSNPVAPPVAAPGVAR